MRQGGEVVILGGGVIGLTTAYFLGRDGVSVRLLDRGRVGGEASWAGAGILPPSDWETAREPTDRLRALGTRLFPELSAELRERTGIDNGYLRCGGLEFAAEGAAPDPHEWSGDGIAVEKLDETAARRLEPALAPGLGTAVHRPALAQLRNPRHLEALRLACLHTGRVQIDEAVEIHEFTRRGNRVHGVVTSGGTVEGNLFLITAGAWTDQLLRPFGIRTGIRPIRGQIALLNPGKPLFRRVLISGPRYLVPRAEGRVLVGSTEEDVGFVKQTTAVGIDGLLQLAVSLVPALAQADVEHCWSGLRPGSPDGRPFLGQVPGPDNVYLAAGHFRAGIQLSPGTALLMKERLLGQPLTMSLEAFHVERAAHDA